MMTYELVIINSAIYLACANYALLSSSFFFYVSCLFVQVTCVNVYVKMLKNESLLFICSCALLCADNIIGSDMSELCVLCGCHEVKESLFFEYRIHQTLIFLTSIIKTKFIIIGVNACIRNTQRAIAVVMQMCTGQKFISK